jgi:hypothetical protein
LWFGAIESGFTQNLRQQRIDLHAGWNSVWLDVNPVDSDPAAVFSGLPLEIVACYFAAESPVQFISDPSSEPWNLEGWGVWYRPDRPDSVLTTLHAIYGQRAYLVFAGEACTLEVTGEVTSEPIRWISRSFNLLGLPVDPGFLPTFSEFFAASSAHQPLRVYRLVDDRWKLVANPQTTPVRAGEAYWVYCEGSSDYQGPVDLALPYPQGVFFPDGKTSARLFLKNTTANPMNVRLDRISSTSDLPLTILVRGIIPGEMSTVHVPMPETLELPVLEPGEETAILFEVRKEQMTEWQQNALLRVSSDAGTQHWIPMSAVRQDLSPAPKKGLALGAQEPHPARGLWVGQVSLDHVNEVAVGVNENNQLEAPDPNEATPSRGVARLRLIIHVDDDGVVRLLKNVAIVRKSEDDPTDVALVTDENLYPNYDMADIPQRFSSATFDFSELGQFLSAAMANAYPLRVNAQSPSGEVAAAAADESINNLSSTIEQIAAAAEAQIDPAVDALMSSQIDLRRSGLIALGLSDRVASDWDDAQTRQVLNEIVQELAEKVYETREIILGKKSGPPTLNAQDRADLREAAREEASFAVARQAQALGGAPLSETELDGSLEVGSTVRGDIFLGAAHPANPYRHKYHPDHSAGFDVTRKILLEPVAPEGADNLLTPAGYGVDRISGHYSEEIFGLHKPLGPAQDIGLKVEGEFVLNRISLIGRINE